MITKKNFLQFLVQNVHNMDYFGLCTLECYIV